MKKLLFFGLLFGAIQVVAQQSGVPAQTPIAISTSDSIRWVNTPRLKFDQNSDAKTDLPERVDNSTKKYFPDISYQPISNCGQYSGVFYTYTYELNRILNKESKNSQNIFSAFFNVYATAQKEAEHTLKTWENMKSIGCLKDNVLGYGSETGSEYYLYSYLDGYHWYYEAMQNKVDDYASISLDSEEGILTMKHWLHNHLAGDSVGGVGILYLGIPSPDTITLTSGYDVGKIVIPELTTYVNHSMTIVGYDDRIEYDFNGDGQITTDMDINGDGIVDVRDWEKGAVIVANSYGIHWANNGFVYIMYRTLAMQSQQKGVWNSSMYVVKPKLQTKPKATFRFSVAHPNKNVLKAYAGVSSNCNSTTPEFLMDIPFFTYISNSSDTMTPIFPIEYGFDVTPLLNHIQPGQKARFFFQIYEIDGQNKYNGYVQNFSVIDYTHGSKEICANTNPVTIANNNLTTLYVDIVPEFSKPTLSPCKLPKVEGGLPYQTEITAQNGTPPYRFRQSDGYQTSSGAHIPTDENGFTQLIFPTGSKASVKVATQFPIQVYDSIHVEDVFINPHGYIQLHNYDYFWPFNNMDYTQLKGHTTIAPLMSNFVFDIPGFGVWYKSTPESLNVHWRCRFEYDIASILDFSANINKNGDIKFEYDTIKYVTFNAWVRGISKGNGVDLSKIGADNIIEANRDYLFKKIATDTSVNVYSNGIVSFTPDANFANKMINVTVLDNNDLECKGSIQLSSSEGSDLRLTGYLLNSDNHQWYSEKDSINVSITIRNTGNTTKHDVQLSLNSTAHYLDKIKTSIIIPEIAENSEITIPNAFVLRSNPILESELIDQVNITTAENESIGILKINLTPQVPLQIGEFVVDSIMANLIRPNSTHTLFISVFNNNRTPIYNINATLSTNVPEVTIQNNNLLIDSIAPFSSAILGFAINTSDFSDPEKLLTFRGELTTATGNHTPFTRSIPFGTSKLVENYENEQQPFVFPSTFSDLTSQNIINFGCSSNKSWMITRPSTMSGPYTLKREIPFYSNTKSNIEFDFNNKVKNAQAIRRMYIMIDQYEITENTISQWTHIDHPVTAGYHKMTILFQFRLPGDTLFIDNLSLPNSTLLPTNSYSVNHSEIKLKCKPDTVLNFDLDISNSTLEFIDYQVIPAANQRCEWLKGDDAFVMENDQSRLLPFNVNTQDLVPGNYTSYIRFNNHHFYTPVKVSLEVIEGYQPPSDGSILVYPNPAKDKITFDFISTDETSAELTIYDVMGREAFSKEQTIDFGTDLKFVTFDISEVSLGNSTKGLYLYRLKVGKDTYQGKITIIQ